MTVPDEAVAAAARAYCKSRYDYSGPYADAAGWEAHVTADAESTGAEGWLTQVLEAAMPFLHCRSCDGHSCPDDAP